MLKSKEEANSVIFGLKENNNELQLKAKTFHKTE